MSLVHKPLPKLKVEVIHGATTYEIQGDCLSVDVTLPENAVSQALISANDYQGKTFLSKTAARDEVKIYMDYVDASTQVFGGYIRELIPNLSDAGEIIAIKATGYGEALTNMRVAEQYGSESFNTSLDTLHEILTDATYGILPKYVRKILASATDSGYTIEDTFDATCTIANIAGAIRYLFFQYKPALNSLNDIIDLVCASKAGSAGPHYIVTVDKFLCVATVANHEAGPANKWPTWWDTDQAGSTIEVTKDMIINQFRSFELDANYMVYAGEFRLPCSGDKWTENNSGLWGSGADTTLSDESTVVKVGSYSLRAAIGAGADTKFYYPSSQDLALDVTAIGGRYNIPTLNFYVRTDSATLNNIRIRLITNPGGGQYWTYLNGPASGATEKEIPRVNEWFVLSLPIGPYYNQAEANLPRSGLGWGVIGAPDWAELDEIRFAETGVADGEYIYIDGLNIAGNVIRAAKDSTLITSDKCKMDLKVDDVPKDDTGEAADDSGTMAQLAYGELLRAKSKPTVGQIVMPGEETILGGQLAHIHASKKADATFNVDTNMRITEHTLRMAGKPHGFQSYLTLTDDLTNSHPRPPMTLWNILAKAVNPDFQTREKGSIKARRIDITQTLLEKDYPS